MQNQAPFNHYEFDDRQRALAMPLGEDRDKALLDMLRERTRSIHFHSQFKMNTCHANFGRDGVMFSATDENVNTSPLNYFCKINGISLDLAERLRTQIGDYANAHDHAAADAAIFKSEKHFSPSEAIKLVCEAFRQFDPDMGEAVQKAWSEGRISFQPSYNPHQGIVHQTDCAPSDIANLPQSLAGQPYISVMVDDKNYRLFGDKQSLTPYGVFMLAHECGHLVAAQRYVDEFKKEKFTPSIPLEETFAELGTELLRAHFTEHYKHDPSMLAATELAYHYGQRTLLLQSVDIANVEQNLQELFAEYEHRNRNDSFLDRVRPSRKENWPEKKAFDAYACEVIHLPFISKLIEPESFYSLAYPLATQAAHEMIATWRKGDTGLPSRLSDVMKTGLNFGEAMTYLGVDIEHPERVENTLADYDAHEKAVLEHVRLSRAQTLNLGKKLSTSEKPDLNARFTSVGLTGLGGTAQITPNHLSRDPKRL